MALDRRMTICDKTFIFPIVSTIRLKLRVTDKTDNANRFYGKNYIEPMGLTNKKEIKGTIFRLFI